MLALFSGELLVELLFRRPSGALRLALGKELRGPLLEGNCDAEEVVGRFGLVGDAGVDSGAVQMEFAGGGRVDVIARRESSHVLLLHPGEAAKVPYVTRVLRDAQGPFIAASDYMKVLPESLTKWVPGQLVSLGTDGFGRSEGRASLRDFFEVDAKHIVLATLHALAREKKIEVKTINQAIKDLGINPEKANPAIS